MLTPEKKKKNFITTIFKKLPKYVNSHSEFCKVNDENLEKWWFVDLGPNMCMLQVGTQITGITHM